MPDPIYKQCLDRIRTDILLLDLPGIADAAGKVRVWWGPWERTPVDHPIVIHPAREDMRSGKGTIAQTDIGYGCQVTMAHSKDGDQAYLETRWNKWRQELRETFHNRRLTNVSEVYKCVVEPTASIPPSFKRQSYEAHALVVRCWSREYAEAATILLEDEGNLILE